MAQARDSQGVVPGATTESLVIPFAKAEQALAELVHALGQATDPEQVLRIRVGISSIKGAAREAKNRELFASASVASEESCRVLGRIMEAQKETVGFNKGRPGPGRGKAGVKTSPAFDELPTLIDAGIDKPLAKKARAAWRRNNDEWEDYLEYVRDAVLRESGRASGRYWRRQEHAKKRAANYRIADGCTIADLADAADAGYRASVIYADPPWSFEVYSGEGKDRSADRHYDTQSLDDICAIPVGALAAEDCALFLWAVMPELPGALKVIEAWGFEYKTTAFTWVKQNRSGGGLFTGMGYWTRANAELCLLATRGSPERIAKDVHQIIMAPVALHSEKPEEARRRIERLLGAPYAVEGLPNATSHLELFARERAPGWTAWGNQIPQAEFLRVAG